MLKNTIVRILSLVVVIGSVKTFAATYINITKFDLWANNHDRQDVIRVIVTDGSGIQNPSGCVDPDSYMVSTTLSEPAKSRIYSALLAAKMADKPVQINILGCETYRPAITNVIIK